MLSRSCTKWLSSTRLETRTKESNIYASIWVMETLMRNESKGGLVVAEVGIRSNGGTIDRSSLVKDLSKSISVGTRKMVIYA